MLQNYLNANLLPINDDGDFKKLKKSADDIAKKIAKSKAKVVSYTLSAIDPNISPDNADIIEVEEIIIKNWSTFAFNAKDTPLTYIRAVILEALHEISQEFNHSLLIWFASRNIVQYHTLIGKEKEIILKFLSQLGSNINQKANTDWKLSGNDSLSKINLELKEVSTYLIDKNSLQKYLEDASGPNNEQNITNFDSPNKFFPDSGDSWSYQFAPKAAEGIKIILDKSLKAINTINSEVLNQILKEISNKNKSLEVRSELLWWKESGYSSSMDMSYHELDKGILGIVLAYDYSSYIPSTYPISVDYFLKETYKGLEGNSEEGLPLEDLLKNLQEHSEKLKPIFFEGDVLIGKSTLLNFISGLLWNKHQLSQLEELVGIPLNIIVSPKELTIWLFHDIQLVKILNTK